MQIFMWLTCTEQATTDNTQVIGFMLLSNHEYEKSDIVLSILWIQTVGGKQGTEGCYWTFSHEIVSSVKL